VDLELGNRRLLALDGGRGLGSPSGSWSSWEGSISGTARSLLYRALVTTRPRSGASRRSPGGSRTFFGLKVEWVSSSYPGVHGTPGIPPHAWCARTPSRRPSLALQQQHQNRGSDEPDEQQLIRDVHQSRPLTPPGPRPGSAPTAHRADGRGLGDALRPGRVFSHFAQTNVGRKTRAPGFSRMAASAL
jgi:hypothetical protein